MPSPMCSIETSEPPPHCPIDSNLEHVSWKLEPRRRMAGWLLSPIMDVMPSPGYQRPNLPGAVSSLATVHIPLVPAACLRKSWVWISGAGGWTLEPRILLAGPTNQHNLLYAHATTSGQTFVIYPCISSHVLLIAGDYPAACRVRLPAIAPAHMHLEDWIVGSGRRTS